MIKIEDNTEIEVNNKMENIGSVERVEKAYRRFEINEKIYEVK